MKNYAHLLNLLLVWSIYLIQPAFRVVGAETNLPAQAEATPAVNTQVTELRDKLDAVQRSNIEAAEKWEALVRQNSQLSNVLSGLQQTLVTQKERELELGKQANSLHLKVIMGAAAAVLLVIILSYWFQMRCFNRVMELSRSLPAIEGRSSALLENGSTPSSKLLGAVKLLEQRIQQLEAPAIRNTSANGVSPEPMPITQTAPSTNIFTDTAESAATASSASLLVAKGQLLLDTERLPEAVNCFSEALALDPTNAEAHLKKGIALERMNRLEQSLSSYEEALRLNPKRAVAYVYKARVLAGLHRYDEALSVYDSALGKSTAKTGSTTLVS